MEFIDPIVAQEEVPKTSAPHDEGKTEQAVHQLESEIDKAYGVVEKRFGDLWSSASKNAEELQEKYKLDERRNDILKQLTAARDNIDDKAKVSDHLAQFESQLKSLGEQVKEVNISDIHIPQIKNIDFKNIGEQANNYLDSLDDKLEAVEKEAGKYVGRFASFLGGLVSVTNDDQATEQTYEKETLFNSSLGSTANYGTTRYDSDLLKLHTSPDMYLNEELDKGIDSFKVDAKTDEIASLLKKYDSTLEKLMNELVPVKIPYNVFWFRYFKLEDDLKAQDLKRKQLLDDEEKRTSNDGEDDEEDFTWDDEDDEEAVDVGDDSDLKKTDKKSSGKDDEDDWE